MRIKLENEEIFSESMKISWLDEEEINKVGDIKISKNGISKLKIHGILPRENKLTAMDWLSQSEGIAKKDIFGHSAEKFIYFLDPSPSGFNIFDGNEEYSSESFSCYTTLISKNKLNIKDNCISSMRWCLDGYENWLSLFIIKMKWKEEIKPEIEIKDPENLTWNTHLGNLHIDTEYEASGGRGKTYVNIKCINYIKIDFSEAKSIEECKNISIKMERFLSTIVSNYKLISYPELYDSENSKIDIFYYRQTINEEEIKPMGSVTSFGLLKEKFGNIFDLYMKNYDVYMSGYYLYVTSSFPGIFTEHQFINYIWGLEALQNHAFPSEAKNSALTEKISRITDILNEILPKSGMEKRDRCWLIRSISGRDNYNLKEKLLSMFLKIPYEFDRNHLNKFVEDVVDLRNTISHYGGKRTPDAPEYIRGMFEKTYAIKMLYLCSILLTIGCDEETILYALLSSHRLTSERYFLEKYGIIKTK